ncbi:competence protein A [mine drainage metagenome]|uniref:Competence protein A n=1 Tax=mine drainage metagenome TaxID=410659 RepID=A0A1J5Q9W0_9ZZZZ
MLGLDVSSSSVKLVELGQDKTGRFILENCAIVPLEPGWIADGNIERFDDVADAVRRLIKKSGTKIKNVVMALPPSAVITKKIVLPGGLSDLELQAQVENEANQYIPFPLEEVSLDFCIVGPSVNATGDVDVLIAAARREKVQDIQGLAEAAGLNPVIVDIESYASRLAANRLIGNLPGQGRDSIIALFELGAVTTTMQVMRNNELMYDRDQAFGGAQLTQMIVRQYGFSMEEAESKKRRGELPEDFQTAVLQPFIENLLQELGRALQFFFTSTTHNKVDMVMLAGGCASLPGLAVAVTQRTGFACSVANPFEGMQMASNIRLKKMEQEMPSYLTSCGLALRRFLK